VDPEAVRAWIASRRAAARRERDHERSAPVPVEVAIASALALIALDGRLHGWPRVEDPLDRRDDDAARRCWGRLRAAFGRP
jgi:hypothetical protein